MENVVRERTFRFARRVNVARNQIDESAFHCRNGGDSTPPGSARAIE
jgi:hypothetical protein